MALRDPFVAYNAANNSEARMVQNALDAAGIEAHIIEDNSPAGMWLGGLLPEIHKATVWIERADIERATPILNDFERRAAELRGADSSGGPIEVVCDECGHRGSFAAAQRGSVQQCPKCNAYVDVGGGEEEAGEWEERAAEQPSADEE